MILVVLYISEHFVGAVRAICSYVYAPVCQVVLQPKLVWVSVLCCAELAALCWTCYCSS